MEKKPYFYVQLPSHPVSGQPQWHDSRIMHDQPHFNVYEDLYIVDTNKATNIEALALTRNVRSLQPKTTQEQIKYLLTKTPTVERMQGDFGERKNVTVYTLALTSFIISNRPDAYLCSENEAVMREAAQVIYESLEEIINDPNIAS